MRGEIENPTAPTTTAIGGYSSSSLSSPRNSEQRSQSQNEQPQNFSPSIVRQSTDPDPVASGSNRQPPRTSIRYRECQRNHAASMGSHVTDGCGEFMPSGEDGTPESLKCAACECHRNFHRKEVEGEQSQPQPQSQLQPQQLLPYHNYYQPNKRNGHSHIQFSTTTPSSLHRFSPVVVAAPPPVMMAFGGAAESSSEDLNIFQSNAAASASKKRFRTKFTSQQKERMMEFAQKLGWKIQKQDEQEVQQFCTQVGVKRKAFKVWMHNNKQTIKKQQM